MEMNHYYNLGDIILNIITNNAFSNANMYKYPTINIFFCMAISRYHRQYHNQTTLLPNITTNHENHHQTLSLTTKTTYCMRHHPQAHMHGESVVRPVFSLSPNDLTALDVDDQFLWGDGIMVAPVITQGATGRQVFFPEVGGCTGLLRGMVGWCLVWLYDMPCEIAWFAVDRVVW